MEAIEICDNVFWTGKIDDRKVPFHRLILERGTTYNSYFLKTGKPTIIDTVDISFGKEYIDNLRKMTDPGKIEYIIINHVEPDHAGALPVLAANAPGAKIVTTELASGLLREMFRLHKREFLIVKDGDTLDIGGKTLQFFETPYLHTEETMVTYDQSDKILFSCDQFSTHIAVKELFDDMAGEDFSADFETYYKLIMSPHRPYVRKMLDKIKKLDIRIIAPSHGYILRKNASGYIEKYDELSNVAASGKKVTIAYGTMTGNTGKIAVSLEEGLKEAGVETQVFNLNNSDISQVKESIFQSDGVLVGSSTKYADMVGKTEELLKSLAGGNYDNKLAAAFGSFAWSGEAIMHIEDYMNQLGFTLVNQRYVLGRTGMATPVFPLRIQFANDQGLELSKEAGRIFGEFIVTR